MSRSDYMLDDPYEEDEDTLSSRYLTFHLGKEDYGIEIRYVIEIVVMQKITEVPDMPAFVRGVINLRGQVIPVMDMRLRFNMEPREYDERTCVIVVDVDGNIVGLIVDTVREVREIPPENIAPAPELGKTEKSRYVAGMARVGDEVKILLDVDRLLKKEELEALEDRKQGA